MIFRQQARLAPWFPLFSLSAAEFEDLKLSAYICQQNLSRQTKIPSTERRTAAAREKPTQKVVCNLCCRRTVLRLAWYAVWIGYRHLLSFFVLALCRADELRCVELCLRRLSGQSADLCVLICVCCFSALVIVPAWLQQLSIVGFYVALICDLHPSACTRWVVQGLVQLHLKLKKENSRWLKRLWQTGLSQYRTSVKRN